eukprot:gene17219-12457_t
MDGEPGYYRDHKVRADGAGAAWIRFRLRVPDSAARVAVVHC